MVEEDSIWDDARVTFPDWEGTLQIDERMTEPWKMLTREVGLDPDRWCIIGFEVNGGETHFSLRVIAVDRDVEITDEENELRATEFYVHGTDPFDILRRMTHDFSMTVRTRYTVGRTVRITALDDLNLDPKYS